jgi:CBS-domain-containing membrane protein
LAPIIAIIGILSERDIVRALAEHGPTVLNEPVSKAMTRDVKTYAENDTIDGLMARMTTGKFRHMPVVEQGKLVGIVSIGDVVKNRVEEIEHEAEAQRDYVRIARSSVLPEILEPIWSHFSVPHRVHDIFVAHVVLKGSSVMPIVSQLIAGGVPQHVWVDRE